MNKEHFEMGMKLMILEKYRDDITAITTDIVIRKNKTTWSTEKKQTLNDNYSFLTFHNNYSGDRKRVECDVTGKMFNPDRVRVFNKKEYESIKKQISDDIAEKTAKQAASDLHKERIAAAFKEYGELRDKLYLERQPILRDSFIKNMCESCKNYQSDGTCKNDSEFYSMGVLKTCNKRFFDSMTTMCQWKSKES